MSTYNNVPSTGQGSSSDQTVQVFDQYYQAPIELNSNVLTTMQAFFEKRGFQPDAAESTALVILKQAKKDNINSMQILDTLKGLSNVEISALVGEILNYNRFKTSFIGRVQQFVPVDDIKRNILA